MDDRQLLSQFVHDRSQPAFHELVRRHTDWLYSVCLRRLHNSALAEDAVQAIFLALARKAPTLLHQPALSPWLHQAAKFACANLQRAERRRVRHESEAAAMIPVAASTDWLAIESVLEPAIDRLSAQDRQTILLRFYEQRSHAQIAAILHISEAAAHKRLERSLDRLRTLLAAGGHHHLSVAALPALLITHAIIPAPSTLTATLATASLTALPPHLAPLTKGILHMTTWLKFQSVAAVSAALLLVAGGGTLLVQKLSAHPPMASSIAATFISAPASSAPSATAPATAPAVRNFVLKLANHDFIYKKNPNADEYQIDTDPAVKHTPASEPANHIKSLAESILEPNTAVERSALVPAFAFRGKRVRLTAWVKTADVQNWAGLQLLSLDAAGHVYSFSDMGAHPIRGTTGWQQYELVADVKDAPMIGVSTVIYGTGEVWSDDFQISAVPPNTPTTDDQNWLKWSFYAPDYSATPDPATPHNGRPSICLAYIGPATAPKDAWGQYNHNLRDIRPYLGHRIRLSVWIKTEKAGYCGPNMRSRALTGDVLTHDSGFRHRTLRGTHDWQLYSVDCDIPKEADAIDSGVVLNGKGKLWIDLDSVTYEIIDGNTPP